MSGPPRVGKIDRKRHALEQAMVTFQTQREAGRVAQVVDYLPSKHKALSSNLIPKKKTVCPNPERKL
jgi:hypothetical protein